MAVKVGSSVITFSDGYTQGTSSPKMWVNWDGTGAAGANQTVRGSYNVSSVYKTATADWTVNFTTSMANANYCILSISNDNARNMTPLDYLTTSIRLQLTDYSVGGIDRDYLFAALWR